MKTTTKAHCNNCRGDRNHAILYTENTHWEREEYGIGGSDRYELLKCAGCDRVMVRHTSWFSEDDEPSVTFYPPATSRHEPSWISDICGKHALEIRQVLREIYIGVQNNMLMLASMGVRALLELVMIDKVGDTGSFKGNLAEFTKQGFVSAKQAEILETVLETGHATIHRSFQPDSADLDTCIDIAEGVLLTVYVHPDQAALLATRVPKREKPQPGG